MERIMESDVTDFKNASSKKTYRKGETIYHESTPSFGFYYIRSGTVKVFSTQDTGKEVILRLATTGDIIGHGQLLSRRYHENTAVALEETDCHFLEGGDFFELTKKFPELLGMFMEKLGSEISFMEKRFAELMKKNVRERMASYFLYMSEFYGEETPDGQRIKVQLSREEIASIIGTASETAIRFISEFKEMKLIKEIDKHFIVMDRERLLNLGRAH